MAKSKKEPDIISTLVQGTSNDVVDEAKRRLEVSIRTVANDIEKASQNRTTGLLLGTNKQGKPVNVPRSKTDTELFTSISEMINGSDKDPAGFGTMLDSLYQKNKKYYSIIKDYEIMPILIPQINRVLMFLVNECLSPDIQNDTTFSIKFTGSTDPDRVQQDIDNIKKEMKLDNQLRDVYMNRYKLGHEYYIVADYTKTFQHMLEMIQKKNLSESTAGMTDLEFLEMQFKPLSETINDFSCNIRINQMTDGSSKPGYTGTEQERNDLSVNENTITLNFEKMNIVVERSGVARYMEDAHAELITEAYSQYSTSYMLEHLNALNEAVVDTSKLEAIVQNLQKKHLQRCTIERLDPAKVFQLKVGGKIIGYFYISDINENTANVVNFAQALKDQLLKARATNLNATAKTAEEIISKQIAEKIINTFDPNIGINRIEAIDLMHDYIRNNEVYKGNKRITFYYADEIYDMSRTDGSILTNGVFFTKLYATLLLNNIMTKVLRGRGRQIHTVHLGASPNV